MKQKFLHVHYVQENFSMFHHLEQGNISVEEYASKFEAYIMKCGFIDDEPQTWLSASKSLHRKSCGIASLV